MSAIPSSFATPTDADDNESGSSGVSWAAILVGALVAAAMGLTLTTLGAGVGLSASSPFTRGSPSSGTLASGAIVWMIVVQAISAALGGYVAGRLRTKWVNVHSDEVFFRDTAHGFAVWAVSVTLTAALLTGAATTVIEGAGRAAGQVAGQVAGMGAAAAMRSASADGGGAVSYYADALLRSDHPSTDTNDAATRAELGRILVVGMRDGQLNAADQTYLAQVVASRTGLSPSDAQQRVAAVTAEANSAAATAEAKARAAAETARRAAEHGAYWLFAGLLLGAFLSSFAATIGGRQRDHLHA